MHGWLDGAKARLGMPLWYIALCSVPSLPGVDNENTSSRTNTIPLLVTCFETLGVLLQRYSGNAGYVDLGDVPTIGLPSSSWRWFEGESISSKQHSTIRSTYLAFKGPCFCFPESVSKREVAKRTQGNLEAPTPFSQSTDVLRGKRGT